MKHRTLTETHTAPYSIRIVYRTWIKENKRRKKNCGILILYVETCQQKIHMLLVCYKRRGEWDRVKKTMIDTERSVIFGLQFELFIDGWQISPIVSPRFMRFGVNWAISAIGVRSLSSSPFRWKIKEFRNENWWNIFAENFHIYFVNDYCVPPSPPPMR